MNKQAELDTYVLTVPIGEDDDPLQVQEYLSDWEYGPRSGGDFDDDGNIVAEFQFDEDQDGELDYVRSALDQFGAYSLKNTRTGEIYKNESDDTTDDAGDYFKGLTSMNKQAEDSYTILNLPAGKKPKVDPEKTYKENMDELDLLLGGDESENDPPQVRVIKSHKKTANKAVKELVLEEYGEGDMALHPDPKVPNVWAVRLTNRPHSRDYDVDLVVYLDEGEVEEVEFDSWPPGSGGGGGGLENWKMSMIKQGEDHIIEMENQDPNAPAELDKDAFFAKVEEVAATLPDGDEFISLWEEWWDPSPGFKEDLTSGAEYVEDRMLNYDTEDSRAYQAKYEDIDPNMPGETREDIRQANDVLIGDTPGDFFKGLTSILKRADLSEVSIERLQEMLAKEENPVSKGIIQDEIDMRSQSSIVDDAEDDLEDPRKWNLARKRAILRRLAKTAKQRKEAGMSDISEERLLQMFERETNPETRKLLEDELKLRDVQKDMETQTSDLDDDLEDPRKWNLAKRIAHRLKKAIDGDVSTGNLFDDPSEVETVNNILDGSDYAPYRNRADTWILADKGGVQTYFDPTSVVPLDKTMMELINNEVVFTQPYTMTWTSRDGVEKFDTTTPNIIEIGYHSEFLEGEGNAAAEEMEDLLNIEAVNWLQSQGYEIMKMGESIDPSIAPESREEIKTRDLDEALKNIANDLSPETAANYDEMTKALDLFYQEHGEDGGSIESDPVASDAAAGLVDRLRELYSPTTDIPEISDDLDEADVWLGRKEKDDEPGIYPTRVNPATASTHAKLALFARQVLGVDEELPDLPDDLVDEADLDDDEEEETDTEEMSIMADQIADLHELLVPDEDELLEEGDGLEDESMADEVMGNDPPLEGIM